MKSEKHDPMKDNPAFARANIEHRFGAPNGNPRLDQSKAVTIRHFMRQLSEMTKQEVTDYIKDESKPMFKRRLAESFIAKQCKPKDLCEFINQVEGMPTQPISNDEPPVVNINITTNGNNQSDQQ